MRCEAVCDERKTSRWPGERSLEITHHDLRITDRRLRVPAIWSDACKRTRSLVNYASLNVIAFNRVGNAPRVDWPGARWPVFWGPVFLGPHKRSEKPQRRRSHKACGASRRTTRHNNTKPRQGRQHSDLSPLPGLWVLGDNHNTCGSRRRLYAAATTAASCTHSLHGSRFLRLAPQALCGRRFGGFVHAFTPQLSFPVARATGFLRSPQPRLCPVRAVG